MQDTGGRDKTFAFLTLPPASHILHPWMDELTAQTCRTNGRNSKSDSGGVPEVPG